jgi:hypothetical protein
MHTPLPSLFMSRASRSFLFMAALAVLQPACGGAVSTLHAKGKASGEGPAEVTVMNASGVVVEGLYTALTAKVDQARASGVEPGSAEDEALWGDDHLGRASLGEGKSSEPLLLPEGRYDVLAVDHDKRELLVKGLRLKPGGKYTLELADGWAQAR